MQRLSAIAPAQKRDSAIGCRRPFRPAFGRISFPFPTLLWQMPKHHHRPAPSTATMRMRRHQPCLLHESNMDKSASPYGTRGLKVRTAKVATLSWPRSLVPTRTGPSTSERPACSRKTSWRLLMLFPERTKLSRTDWSLPTNRTSLRWCTVEWKRLSLISRPLGCPSETRELAKSCSLDIAGVFDGCTTIHTLDRLRSAGITPPLIDH